MTPIFVTHGSNFAMLQVVSLKCLKSASAEQLCSLAASDCTCLHACTAISETVNAGAQARSLYWGS